jgi:hypothetical protein
MNFDLEAAKSGALVRTISGTEVRFLAHVPGANSRQRVIVLMDDEIHTYTEEGFFFAPDDLRSTLDLVTIQPKEPQ